LIDQKLHITTSTLLFLRHLSSFANASFRLQSISFATVQSSDFRFLNSLTGPHLSVVFARGVHPMGGRSAMLYRNLGVK